MKREDESTSSRTAQSQCARVLAWHRTLSRRSRLPFRIAYRHTLHYCAATPVAPPRMKEEERAAGKSGRHA
eukprot:1339679-Pleurochrysis_carterae.AAC.2